MTFPYRILYTVFIINLFVSYNPTLCKTYKYTREYLLNNHLFYLEPPQTAFAQDIKPISYPDKCDLKQLHLVTRHGSRYPDANSILFFDELEKIFANVSVAKNWYKNPFLMRQNFQLIKRGELEPYFDGLQSRKRYAKFWDGVKYDPEVVKFQSTQTSRTGASIMAFSEGLFNGKGSLDNCKSQPIYYTTTPNQDDTLFMFHACRRWNETVFSNNKVLDEQFYIYGNKTLAPIAKRISEEYNISPPLDPIFVPHIFNNCQFWLTVYNRTDAWCPLLSPKELLLSRHYWDLFYYQIVSYGNPLNERLGCRYLTQLVNGVEDHLNGNSSMIADLRNAHSFTIYMILTTMYPVSADLTYEQIKELEYTEYRLIRWSSTLYFEIYKCSGDTVLIRVLLDFKPFLIPGCDSEYCEWNKFKEILGDKIGCDFEKMCAYP
ncbi:2816_t:CDS:2 [Funneliformis caledonium]|uniref:Multiple inositol polyphosphate phosphatase 1 n=1 Tax=Funneliformis caledonium TaxID=1117310 RepID=A0A9N8ZC78_9GLOM|nr:2816_t:CDS:2 [Funneliformis caledonium]